MIQFENEIIKFLGLPSIPKRTWDGKSSFDKGVAVVSLYGDREAYAVAKFDADKDKTPRIVKTFGIERFIGVKQVFVVPNYMATEEDVKAMDLDDESKKKAEELLKEANEMENEGTQEEGNPMDKLPVWIFPEIESREQAEAWLRDYNYRNHIKKGKIPSTDENLKLRLFSIYTELQKKQK